MARAFGRELRFRQHAIRCQAAARLAREGQPRADDVEKDVGLERSQLLEVYARAPDQTTASLDAALERARVDAGFLATRTELSKPVRDRWLRVANDLSNVAVKP